MEINILPSFLNDLVVVSTIAIIIGQNLRNDLKETVSFSKKSTQDHIATINDRHDRDITQGFSETTAQQYDLIRNYQTSTLCGFDIFFYVMIFCSLFINTGRVFFDNTILLTIFQFLESVLQISLLVGFGTFGLVLWRIKKNHADFINKCHNFCTAITLAADINEQNNT